MLWEGLQGGCRRCWGLRRLLLRTAEWTIRSASAPFRALRFRHRPPWRTLSVRHKAKSLPQGRLLNGRFGEPPRPLGRSVFESHPLRPAQSKKPPAGEAFYFVLAERVGFEPTVGSPLRLISSQVHSTTLPPLLVRQFSYSSLLWRRGWDSNPRMGCPIA